MKHEHDNSAQSHSRESFGDARQGEHESESQQNNQERPEQWRDETGHDGYLRCGPRESGALTTPRLPTYPPHAAGVGASDVILRGDFRGPQRRAIDQFTANGRN